MLLRVYLVAAGVLAASYLAWPAGLRQWPFVLLSLGTMPAVLVGLRRAPRGRRLPWWFLVAALACYNVGNLLWLWLADAQGHRTGNGTVADLFVSVAGLFVLIASVMVVLRSGRDVGGLIDSVITAVALSGLLWDVVLLPALTAGQVTETRQVTLFINIFLMAGALGGMARVSFSGGPALAPIRFLTGGIALCLLGIVSGVIFMGADGMRPDWTNMAYLAAYAMLGGAALHPAVGAVTVPVPRRDDDLTRGRLAFLGVMLALTPLIGGGRAMVGLPVDGTLIAVSSAALIPLVMIRIARLSFARREAELALRQLATSDGLTGLANRNACLARLSTELETGRDELAVLFADLDGFKPVNDLLGHAAGDDLLVTVAARLGECVRDEDLVSRFGGDEFVIICRGPRAVEAVTARIREMVAEPFEVNGVPVSIGVSVGAAHAHPDDTEDSLIRRADTAMYEAKRAKSVGTLSLVLAA